MRAFVCITAHGFGHLAQTAPVVRALQQRMEGLNVTVRSSLPVALVSDAIPGSTVESSDDDFGIPMDGLACASAELILEAWRNQAAQSDTIINTMTTRLSREQYDFVISGVSPWPLASARLADIPGFGVGSFCWTDILSDLCGHLPDSQQINALVTSAYAQSTELFRLSPGLGMRNLVSTHITGVIATTGLPRRSQIADRLGKSRSAKIIVLAFGGMLPDRCPPFARSSGDWIVLGPSAWADGKLMHAADQLGLTFRDLLASADLVVSKAGYGIGAELGCLGVPSILVRRPDWPEDAALSAWLQSHAPCMIVDDIASVDTALIENTIQAPTQIMAAARPGAEIRIAEAIASRLSTSVFQSPNTHEHLKAQTS